MKSAPQHPLNYRSKRGRDETTRGRTDRPNEELEAPLHCEDETPEASTLGFATGRELRFSAQTRNSMAYPRQVHAVMCYM
jgi:hypothetical protein